MIFNYITQELNLQIKKFHEFTVYFFEMFHAKIEQDTAWVNITQRATFAVPRCETSITFAKDLCEYLSRTFKNPTSQSESVTLKKQVFFYVPVDGDGAVPWGIQGCKFKEF